MRGNLSSRAMPSSARSDEIPNTRDAGLRTAAEDAADGFPAINTGMRGALSVDVWSGVIHGWHPREARNNVSFL